MMNRTLKPGFSMMGFGSWLTVTQVEPRFPEIEGNITSDRSHWDRKVMAVWLEAIAVCLHSTFASSEVHSSKSQG